MVAFCVRRRFNRPQMSKKLDWDRERRNRPVRTRGAEQIATEHGYHVPASDAQVEALENLGYRGRPQSSAHARELLRELQGRTKQQGNTRQTEAAAAAEMNIDARAVARLRTLALTARGAEGNALLSEGKALLSELETHYRGQPRTKRRDAAYQFLRAQIKDAIRRR
jgi:hypothetical protein